MLRIFRTAIVATIVATIIATTVSLSQVARAQQEVKTQAQPQAGIEEIKVEGQYLSTDQINSVKTPTPIIDVPQSVSIISSEDIFERGINSIGEIIDYTAGVNTSQGEGHRDAIVFRGIISTADFYLDGNRDDVQYYRGLYNVEQIEILRGPNALLFGRGGTGGILNRVSKKAAIGEAFTGYRTTLDTLGAFGFEIDHNLSSSDTSAIRINAMYESLENHRDFFEGERIGFNPTARFELTPDTLLDLSYEYANHERFIDRGVPTGSDGRPVEAFEDIVFGSPDFNNSTLEAHLFRAAVQHNFSDTMKANFSAFYGDYEKFYDNFYATGYDQVNSPNIVELDGYLDLTDRQNLILSSNLVSEFQTGALRHTFIIGGEYIDTSSDQFRFNPVFDAPNRGDMLTPERRETFAVARPLSFNGNTGINTRIDAMGNFSSAPTTFTFSSLNDDTRVNVDVVSLYVQDHIEISEKLDILVGVRFDSFDIEVFDAKVGETRDRKDDAFSPRFGVIYKPQENISVYGSYSESFLPRSGEQYADINGDANRLDPDTFANREVGLKWDFAQGLSLTAALFENEQSSPQVADSNASTLDVIVSQISGFELQLSGYISDSWTIAASYTHLDGEQVDRSGPTGLAPREMPEHMFSIWNQVLIAESFGVGFGLTYQDESFINNGNSAFLPSYTRLDASAYYQVSEKLRLQVNIENLTDELYFPNAHSTHQATVAAPLNAIFSVTGQF